jgi:hypothetical protein
MVTKVSIIIKVVWGFPTQSLLRGNACRFSCKASYCCPVKTKTGIVDKFQWNCRYRISRKYVQSFSSCYRHTDRRTDRYMVKASRYIFVTSRSKRAPENGS